MNTVTPIADPWRMQIVMLPIRHITADEARDDRIAAVRRATGQRRSDSTRQRILEALDDGELTSAAIGQAIGHALSAGLMKHLHALRADGCITSRVGPFNALHWRVI